MKPKMKLTKKRLLIVAAALVVAALFAVAIVVLVRAGAFRPSPPRGSANVLLVSIDTLRRDHVSAYGYERRTTPALDRLAGEGVLFERAITLAPWTLPSHMTALTGLAPSTHGVEDYQDSLGDEVRTLAQTFRDSGYRTGAIVTASFLSPAYGFDRGFDHYDHPKDEKSSADAKEVVDRALEWLEDIDRDERFFLFVHFWDVHWPYLPPPGYEERFGGEPGERKWGKAGYLQKYSDTTERYPEEGRRQTLALYDGAIRYTDEELDRLLAAVDQREPSSENVVVVFSDHGEEFGEHGSFGHGHSFYSEVIDVPLIVRCPGRLPAGRRISELVSTGDIPSTLLELAGLESRGQFLQEAVSLVDLWGSSQAPDRFAARRLIMESTRRGPKRLGMIDRFYKYISRFSFHPYGRKKRWVTIREGIYDLQKDPAEEKNLFRGEVTPEIEAIGREMRGEITSFRKKRFSGAVLDCRVAEGGERVRLEGELHLEPPAYDEAAGIGLEWGDQVRTTKERREISFRINPRPAREKQLLLPLPEEMEAIEVLIRVRGEEKPIVDRQVELPDTDGEIPLLELGATECTLRGTIHEGRRNRRDADLSPQLIERLEEMGYLQ
ncbi:MAG: sulfatase [Polyangia bacterium]